MEKLPTELDHFAHALISPLTAIQGAVGLLRRRLQHIPDERIGDLLITLERASERLRHTSDTLAHSARLQGERLIIELPATAFTDKRPVVRALAAVTTAATSITPPNDNKPDTDASLILMVARAEGAALALGEALERTGRRLIWAENTALGLDLARTERPTALVLDAQLDSNVEAAIGILSADPDTKALALVIIGPPTSANDGRVMLGSELTVEEQAATVVRAISEGQAQRQSKPHILIVDDEADIGGLLALQFQDEGYLTTQLHSGTEALRIVRQQRFDLILLDLLLPDLDGFAVLGGLRAQPETQLTPVILLSAINSPADKVRGLQLGADDYITKPFSGPELSARVQAAMRRSEREGGANPSTRLPGNTAIERAIAGRIEQGAAFAVCYADLDNFKAYNDSYGFLKGDAVIQRTAQILLDAVREQGNADDFVGHIGGDDFVVISTPDRVRQICASALAHFDATAPLFYDREARARGYISAVDRQGQATNFPLLSLSISAVSDQRRPFRHPGEVAQRSVEPKKQAKLIPGSVYLIDE